MKINKLGHCCILIEEKGVRILTDPGIFTTIQDSLTDIDLVLITHEHADHFHIQSLKKILENNPNAKIITNKGVGKILDLEKIAYQLIENNQKTEFMGVLIEGFGGEHAEIYKTIQPVENTGYFVANSFFYPGDAFINPQKPVEILALPVVGPWMKISEALDYALELKPENCFPVHDCFLKIPGVFHRLPQSILSQAGINFIIPKDGEEFII